MNQQNTQPLYKVLNEKRTEGKVLVNETVLINSIPCVFTLHSEHENISNGKSICSFRTSDEREDLKEYRYDLPQTIANAQYTALAVNNLANVADALSKAIDYEKDKRELFEIMEDEYIAPDWFNEAKEALKSIS